MRATKQAESFPRGPDWTLCGQPNTLYVISEMKGLSEFPMEFLFCREHISPRAPFAWKYLPSHPKKAKAGHSGGNISSITHLGLANMLMWQAIKEKRDDYSNIDRYRNIINVILLCVMHDNK